MNIKQIMVNKDRSGLSKALETLAIIAYKQPVTRMEIQESLRGVKAKAPYKDFLIGL